jgi:hypothetical protein
MQSIISLYTCLDRAPETLNCEATKPEIPTPVIGKCNTLNTHLSLQKHTNKISIVPMCSQPTSIPSVLSKLFMEQPLKG